MRLTVYRAKMIFESYLDESGYRKETIRSRLSYLNHFFDYLPARADLRDVNKDTVFQFLHELSGKDLSRSTKRMILSTLRTFFSSLYVKGTILSHPVPEQFYFAEEIKKHKEILSEDQVSAFLDGIDLSKDQGLRNRALFELIYSSALRASEASSLMCDQINWKHRIVMIRKAKNSKDRMVPMTEVACYFLKKYLNGRKQGRVFSLERSSINRLFKQYLKELDLFRSGLSVHSLRHSAAVHLLNHGAGIRYVQELLGHDSVETTVVYTHQLDDSLKKVYKSHHPRENRYFREADDAYRKRIEELKFRLQALEKKKD